VSPSRAVQVLIVEDDALVSEVIHALLEQVGYAVIGEAPDGKQAVEMTRSLQPDVVLMDINMPAMDGIQAAQQIQDTCPTPIVVLTAHETPELVARASEAGVGAYLVKPSSPRDMERAVTIARARFRDLMELRRLNAELRVHNKELQEALATVKTLSGLLPICAKCKKVRNDQGYWQHVEAYLREHSTVEFTHGLCPDCWQELYPRDVYPHLYEDGKPAAGANKP
jgi:AmiR/NasT family two-component response regulator